MVEVPSLLWQLDELMRTVDFVSVGSNDLFQFVHGERPRQYAASPSRFDPLSRPFLRALKQIVDAARAGSVAGDALRRMAGRPIAAMALLGIGYRSLSMSPASIGPVKAMLTRAAARPADGDARNLARPIPTPTRNVRAELVGFAETHNVPL